MPPIPVNPNRAGAASLACSHAIRWVACGAGGLSGGTNPCEVGGHVPLRVGPPTARITSQVRTESAFLPYLRCHRPSRLADSATPSSRTPASKGPGWDDRELGVFGQDRFSRPGAPATGHQLPRNRESGVRVGPRLRPSADGAEPGEAGQNGPGGPPGVCRHLQSACKPQSAPPRRRTGLASRGTSNYVSPAAVSISVGHARAWCSWKETEGT